MAAPHVDRRLESPIAGKYRLDRVLGSGGFGTVYAGTHEWTGRPIAAKVMDPALAQRADYVQRFLREARVAARLSHPHVVDVLDMGRDEDGTVYLILEYLEGEDLAQRLKRDKHLGLQQAFAILLPIMDALAEAHSQGIVHRDLKPANIFLSVDKRGREVPKLLDFGIAKDAGDVSMTKTGQIWGTPHFMSPEQASGSRTLGPDADVWAMGVVLFRTLSGKMPFNAASSGEMVVKLLTETAPSLRTAMEVPDVIADAVDRALLRDREERYPDMGMFFSALVGAARSQGFLPSAMASILDRRDLGSSQTVVNLEAATEDEFVYDNTTPKAQDFVSGVMPVSDPPEGHRPSQAPTDPRLHAPAETPVRPTVPMDQAPFTVVARPDEPADPAPAAPSSGPSPWVLGAAAALVALLVAVLTIALVLSLARSPQEPSRTLQDDLQIYDAPPA